MRNLTLLRLALARLPLSTAASVLACAADGAEERAFLLTDEAIVYVASLTNGKVPAAMTLCAYSALA